MSESDEIAEVAKTGAKAVEWTERHEAAIEAAYVAGATMKTLADSSALYGSAETIRKVLARRGVASRPAGWAGRVRD